jgi:hypothetical protein
LKKCEGNSRLKPLPQKHLKKWGSNFEKMWLKFAAKAALTETFEKMWLKFAAKAAPTFLLLTQSFNWHCGSGFSREWALCVRPIVGV